MGKPLDQRRFIWVIDGADKIVHVNDDWLAFAAENFTPQLTASVVLDQYIWRFIQGQETSYLYRQIFRRVRAGNSPVKIPFRCDSPDCRRFMEMELTLLPGDAIQFMAHILREGNFPGAAARGDADLRPGDAPDLAEIGQDEALLGRVNKVLGAGAVLQTLAIEGFQFRHGQGEGRLIIVGAGHAASFLVSGASRPARPDKVRRGSRPPASARCGGVQPEFGFSPES
jgi:hypothetical protein